MVQKGLYEGDFVCMNIQTAVDETGNSTDMNANCSLDNAILTEKRNSDKLNLVAVLMSNFPANKMPGLF